MGAKTKRQRLTKSKSAKTLMNIITPVFNEGTNFPDLYKAVSKNIQIPYRLIIVYDFDEDDTLPVVKKYQKKDDSLILLKNTKGRGVLNAITSGFGYIESGPVLVMMGDLSDDLSIVHRMYNEYSNGATVVCPSRYMKGGKEIGGPFVKRTLSRLSGVSLYYLRGVPTHDITNNYRLYDKEFINKIEIESTGGFEIAMEITLKAFRSGKKIVELPTTWQDRTAGEAKFKLWKWLPSYLRWYFFAFGPIQRDR